MWLALSRVGNAVGHRAADRFRTRHGPPGSNLEAAFEHPESMRVDLLPNELDWEAALLAAEHGLDAAEEEMIRAERFGARVLDVEDAEYPERLRAVADAPLALFVLGSLEPCDARGVAVVGSRASTRYGAEMTRRIVAPLAYRRLTIVSGMAKGIDAAAHRAALEGGTRTIAVLGTGIDVCYPDSSKDLYERIPGRGAILSESAPGTIAYPSVFKPRNRIVSALSKAVVVVEARLQSGALNTAAHARDQGRDLYAVPGDADIARSEGANRLMTEFSAVPALSGTDVLWKSFSHLYEDDDVRGVVAPESLDPVQVRVRDLLKDGGASFDELLARAGMTVPRLLAVLSGLERAGIAHRNERGQYVRFGKTHVSG